jgi:hypothetical protein
VVDASGELTGDGAQRMYAVAESDIGVVAAGTDVLAAGTDNSNRTAIGTRRSGRRSTARAGSVCPGTIHR